MAARSGRKTCTIRLGTVEVARSEVHLSDGRESTRIRVTNVDHSKRFGELGEREAKGEGFSTREELQADLKRYYRAINNDSPVTVIWFEIAD